MPLLPWKPKLCMKKPAEQHSDARSTSGRPNITQTSTSQRRTAPEYPPGLLTSVVGITVWLAFLWLSKMPVFLFDFLQFSYAVYAFVVLSVALYYFSWTSPRKPPLFQPWPTAVLILLIIAGLRGTIHTKDIPQWLITPEIDLRDSWTYFRNFTIPGIVLLLISQLLGALYSTGQKSKPTEFALTAFTLLAATAVIISTLVSGQSFSAIVESADDRAVILESLGLHPNTIAAILLTAYPIALAHWIGPNSNRQKTLAALTALLVIVAILLTYARGALIPLAFTTTSFLRRAGTAVRAAFIVPSVTIGILLLGSVLQRLTYGGNAGEADISAGRIEYIWLPIIPDVLKNLFFGTGLHSILWVDAQQNQEIFPVGLAHNGYLDLLLDVGLTGAALIIGWVTWLYRTTTKLQQREVDLNYVHLAWALKCALISMMIYALTNERLTPTSTQAFVWALSGIIVGRLNYLSKKYNRT